MLFVVSDNRRQHAISQVALEGARLLKANPTMIWVTQRERITPETALSAPWVVVGRETPVTFQGLAEPVETSSNVAQAASDEVVKENAVVFAGNGGQFG